MEKNSLKDKYIWWGVLGIGVAAFFWYLTKQQISSQQSTPTQTTYLVPQPLTQGEIASQSANTTLSEQRNIVGTHPNSTVDNGSNTSFLSAPVNNLQPVNPQTANQPVGA